MRIEGRDQRRPPLGPRARDRAPDHRLVPEVKAIEIAERDDPAREMRRHRRAPSSRSIRGALYGGRQRSHPSAAAISVTKLYAGASPAAATSSRAASRQPANAGTRVPVGRGMNLGQLDPVCAVEEEGEDLRAADHRHIRRPLAPAPPRACARPPRPRRARRRSRVSTIWRRPGRSPGRLSNVLRPMIIGLPIGQRLEALEVGGQPPGQVAVPADHAIVAAREHESHARRLRGDSSAFVMPGPCRGAARAARIPYVQWKASTTSATAIAITPHPIRAEPTMTPSCKRPRCLVGIVLSSPPRFEPIGTADNVRIPAEGEYLPIEVQTATAALYAAAQHSRGERNPHIRRRRLPTVSAGFRVAAAAPGCAQLLLGLLDMVGIEVAVAAGPHELADFQSALLRQHVGEQRIGGDVERHA